MRTEIRMTLLLAIPATFLPLMMLLLLGFIVYPVQAQAIAFDKSNFHNPLKIDNKYYPLEVGNVMIYNGTDEDGNPTKDFVTVTNDTKVIQGIATRVVNDSSFVKGELEETTNDWFVILP